jgi:glycosyltransferase A (GT-A) superfamily protein (DUF2064 family)
VFQGVPWSTGAVLEETVTRARALGLSIYLLPELSDVDRLEDLPPAYEVL